MKMKARAQPRLRTPQPLDGATQLWLQMHFLLLFLDKPAAIASTKNCR
jgi:hypothetical protein